MKKILGLITIVLLVISCVGIASMASGTDELDLAIRDASDYLNDNIPKGSMIAILNIQSSSATLSDYIIDELIANAVNDKIFKVVDRQQLDSIKAEQNFQYSGDVDDNLAVSIGKFLGAQIIVSGRFSQIENRYRMIIRALDVQTAQVQGQYNRNISAGSTITALMRSGGSSAGGSQSAAVRTTVTIGATNKNTTSSAANAAPVSTAPEGALVVNNSAAWNSAVNRIRNGGNDKTYVIHVTGNNSVPAPPDNENIFGSVTGINVTIQGGGALSLSVSGCLMQIGASQTVIVRDVTLRGRSGNSNPVVKIMSGGIFRLEGNAIVTENINRYYGGGVFVSGGVFIMQDNAKVRNNNAYLGGGIYISDGIYNFESGTITGNTASSSMGSGGNGGGVYINRGTFTMRGGMISGNSARGGHYSSGGGIYINGGTFTLQNGAITGNTATGGNGGGVYITGGTFAMQGGNISHSNNTNKNGGGVYITGGTFNKTGGIINGNDVTFNDRNTATEQGHALYWSSQPNRWRNATASSSDNTGDFGFWLND